MNRALVIAAVMTALAAASDQTNTDWPQWRGPNRDGSVLAALPA